MHETLMQDQEIWDHFTRKKDYYYENLDNYSHSRCIESDLIEILEPNVSKYLVKHGLEVEFPENKTFAVCLTHDVDDIYPPFYHSVISSAHCLSALNFRSFADHLLWKFRGKNYSPYLNLFEIMDLEANFGAKSSFYFITSETDPVRFRYNIEDIGDYLGDVSDKGWEIGLHGGYYSYNNSEAINEEKKRLEAALGKKVVGFRNNYLRFKIPDSWEILADAGFKYDSTFGYNNSIGFRNGMCHPFKPYNLKQGQQIEILEIPLVIMDVALFDNFKSFQEAWENTKNLIDVTASLNGVITLLWHNFVFGCSFRKDWIKLYEKVLKYSSEKGAWITSAEEIYKWWENRL